MNKIIRILVLVTILSFVFMCYAFAQYQDITVTRDLDPNAVYDTYQDWVTKNPPQQTNFFEVSRIYSNQRDEGFLIVVNNNLYGNIEQSVQVYQQDLTDEGFNTFVVEFDGTSFEDLKQQIVSYYQTENIVNIVLIGNLPVAWFELFEDWNNNGVQDPDENWVEFPCDLYFTDTDGIWNDTDGNGIFDYHEGDKHPEIGMGRIVANNMYMLNLSESELLNNYFQRNHLFRSGIITSFNTALAYVDDDWANSGYYYQQCMQMAYPLVELVNDIEQTNAGDYLNNRLISDYELIQVHAHSSPNAHYFYYNNGSSHQLVHDYEIATINPTAHFYNLFACSNSRFTTSNNMGGMYIYSSEHGLATIGSTKTGSMLGFYNFYQPLSEDKTIGESLRLWWECNVDTGVGWRWQRTWFYGMIIQGDPSLKKQYEQNTEIFAYFEADITIGYAPQQVNFTDLSVSPNTIVSWQWDFQNDGIIDSYEQNPSYTYYDTCSYSVSLTVSDINDSTDTEIREDYINIYIPNVHNITQGTHYGTIQQSIDCANAGDTIIVDENIYVENINFNGENITVASKYLTTKDTSYISQTIIDGNQNGSVITFENGEDSSTVLCGFTITNGCYDYGGGICCLYSDPTLVNVTITGNSTDWHGGGILCMESSPSLENVTLTGNDAGENGGGICCWNSSPILQNVTITANSADEGGGGISCHHNSSPIIVNSILWNNSQQEVFFSGEDDPSTITISYSDIEGGEAGIVTNNNGTVNWLEGNIDADPLFADPENGDFHLTWANFPIPDSTMSPCIDAGDPNSPLDPDSTRADIGAYYFDQSQQGIEDTPIIHTSCLLYQNYPNPFHTSTTISFNLATKSHQNTQIKIYNIKGQLVKILAPMTNDKCPMTSIIWDGKDESGKPLSSGIYIYCLKVGDKVIDTKKCLLLK